MTKCHTILEISQLTVMICMTLTIVSLKLRTKIKQFKTRQLNRQKFANKANLVTSIWREKVHTQLTLSS